MSPTAVRRMAGRRQASTTIANPPHRQPRCCAIPDWLSIHGEIMMKTSAMNGMSRRLQASSLGRQMKRHRFWIGLTAGAAVVWASSGSLGALAATGVGAVLLSVLPCALMMGLCMRMMHHGDDGSCDTANKTMEPPPLPALPAPADNAGVSRVRETVCSPATLSGERAPARMPAPSTKLVG